MATCLTTGYAIELDASLQACPCQSVTCGPKEMGPAHCSDHAGTILRPFLAWKVDYNLVNTANSFEVTKSVVVEQSQPWFPELGTFVMIALNAEYLSI